MSNGTPPTPPPIDHTDHYLKLYELQKDSLDERRDVEWKVALGFWGAIGIATGFLITKVQLLCWSGYFYIAFFVVISIWFLKLWHSNEIDHEAIKLYRSEAEKAANIPQHKEINARPYFLKDCKIIWPMAEIVTTGLLLFASWYLLTTTPVNGDTKEEKVYKCKHHNNRMFDGCCPKADSVE